MSQINNSTSTSALSQIMDTIDLGPTGSIQLQFAKLQLAQSQLCKNEAENYMNQIEDIQNEQKKTSEMIAEARKLQQQAKNSGDCTAMPAEMEKFFKERGLSFDTDAGDNLHTAEQWDYNLKSLTNYQEQVGTKTQTLMVYLQDFIGQYNSYQEGAMSAISQATQVTRSIAKGQ